MKKIAIIGEGNVATHLGKAFHVNFSKSINAINKSADIFIIAVNDDAITKVAKKLKINNKIVVHTSGSVDMHVLKSYSENYGVLYPLQTISKKRKISLKEVPICIEASNKKTEKILFSLSKSISKNIYRVNSKQRRMIHLSAVFANNFSNHMYAIAENILKKERLPLSLLKPLIVETANKILEMSPGEAQTGPAKRGDKKTMSEHIKLLSKQKNYRDLYKLISKSIVQFT